MTDLDERIDQRSRAVTPGRSVVLIVNLHARRGAAAYDRARQLLAEKGFSVTQGFPVRDAARIPELVAGAVAQGHRFVVIGGGDGTISAAFDVLAFSDTVCGILPLGTANSFARSLHLPLDLDAAVDVLDKGQALQVDLGRIDGRYFGTAAAIGLSAAIGRRKPRVLKKLIGRAAYPAVAAVVLPQFKPFPCTLHFASGGQRRWDDVLEVRIANASYEGGVEAAPDADVTSGDLVVHLVTGRSKWRLVSTWSKIVAGLDPNGRGFHALRAERFRIDTEPPHDINIDGETGTRTPADVSIARKALTVLVPASSVPEHRRSRPAD